MRIHPDVLSGKTKWQLPAALFLLALTVFAFGFFSVNDNRAIATQSNQITKLQIVILKTNLEAGHELSREDLGLEVRGIESVPEGALTQVEEGVGKYLAGNVHAGTALAVGMLRGDDVAKASSEEEAKAEPRVEEVLNESDSMFVKSHEKVTIPAVMSVRARSERIRELESMEKSSQPAISTSPNALPNKLAVLEKPVSRLNLGIAGEPPKHELQSRTLSEPREQSENIEPPTSEKLAASVAADELATQNVASKNLESSAKIHSDRNETSGLANSQSGITNERLAGEEPEVRAREKAQLRAETKKAPPKVARNKFNSYAWVNGAPVTFGISKTGKIQVVGSDGTVSPLDSYREEDSTEEER